MGKAKIDQRNHPRSTNSHAASATATADQKPIISRGLRKKQRLRTRPSVSARPYSATAMTATTKTKTGGVNIHAMRPVVPILQNVKASLSYFSALLRAGRSIV